MSRWQAALQRSIRTKLLALVLLPLAGVLPLLGLLLLGWSDVAFDRMQGDLVGLHSIRAACDPPRSPSCRRTRASQMPPPGRS